MADSYKDIIITPNRSNTADPKIDLRGGNSSVNTAITVTVYPDSNGTLSFDGSAGQLFSITNDLSGLLWSVNDVSGIPSAEVYANGSVRLAEFSGNVSIGTATNSSKLFVNGNTTVNGSINVTSTMAAGNTTITGFANVSSTLNAAGAITQNGNQVLHAGNYTSYAPSLTGSGASGNWGINVTGSSASTTGNAGTATTLQTARTITVGSTGRSFNGSADISWSLSDIGAAATSHTHSISAITDAARWWNNFGDNHNTRTSFDATTPSIGFGWRYVQGSTNGPGVNGASQYYLVYVGLGNDYGSTGSGSYGMQIAYPRNVTTPYITIRYNEANSLGAWQKISAGYADSAGAVDFNNLTNKGSGTGTYTTSGDFRAPIFYDSNDTSYYVDANGTSVLGSVNTWGEIGPRRNDSGTLLRSYNTSASSSLQFYLDHSGGNVNIGNNRGVVFGGGSYWEIANSVRSPIFYDSNNTSYYVDPTSTTSLRTAGSWRSDSSAWDGEFAGKIQYHINHWYFQAAGDWYFRRADSLTAFYITQGGTVGASSDLRAPIFYDSVDTSYRIDANDNSVLNTLTMAGFIQGRSSASTDVNSANDTGSISIRGSTTTVAAMSFHRTGAYAINMGLGTDNVFRIGGWSASSNAFQMDGSGNLTMLNNVTAYSDARLKKDIVKIDNAIDKVQQLNGYTYTRTDTGSRQCGVIAQEVMKVLPEVVMGSEETNYSVAYGNMVGLLIEAIKEQQEQINRLEVKINSLQQGN